MIYFRPLRFYTTPDFLIDNYVFIASNVLGAADILAALQGRTGKALQNEVQDEEELQK